MKINIFAILLFFLILIMLTVFSVSAYYREHVVIGSVHEREHLISATSMYLVERGHQASDIKRIKVNYNYWKGGVIPYSVGVTFRKDPKNIYFYGWENSKKKSPTV